MAFRLYCRTPFGKLHQSNPEIIDLARRLNRTVSAVGMKACNFASLDPTHRERGVGGLSNVSALDEQIWSEFKANPESVAAEAELAYDRLLEQPEGPADPFPEPLRLPTGPTDREQLVRVRRVQRFFRTAVLTSYGHRCALTGLDVPELLVASHIVPWAANVERRADPTNGLCLNALVDRAFDSGWITFESDLSVVVSSRARKHPILEPLLVPGGLDGRKLTPPARFAPDQEALSYHRAAVFVQ